NAYIGEIAAADPRLAQWAEAQGMTLEEAAMVQPAYGSPRVSSVAQIRLDSLLRPWAFGGDINFIGGSALFYRDSLKWKLHSSVFSSWGFCLTRAGLPLVFDGSNAVWKARNYVLPSSIPSSSAVGQVCEWNPQGTEAWVGTQRGLYRLRRGGSADTLAGMRFSTLLASDTVTGVTVNAAGVWAATQRGIYRRSVSGTDTTVTVWDSAALSGKGVTGFTAGAGTAVWVGFGGATSSFARTFSTQGLRRYNGASWTQYRASMSSIFVPSDTVMALGIRDTGTVWIAVRSGFYRFPSTGGALGGKVADMPTGVTVHDIAGNAQGFYAGTSNGVYQFRNDSLVHLGSPAVSILGATAGKRLQAVPRLQVLSAEEARRLGKARSVLGRQTGPQAGAGVYLVQPSKSPE
ncbi:MAG: hypothetical protein K0Q91_978, partial [Fibrobacteria bacterium]|nr:hypothetical protein [Fibrobacteria bacterium]